MSPAVTGRTRAWGPLTVRLMLAQTAVLAVGLLIVVVTAVLIGPGMADKEETRGLVEAVLPHLEGPVALDALGLAAVTADPACLHHLGGRIVLTPNPTELAITLHLDPDEVDADPAGAARRLAEQAQAAVGLGGETLKVLRSDRGGSTGEGSRPSRASASRISPTRPSARISAGTRSRQPGRYR